MNVLTCLAVNLVADGQESVFSSTGWVKSITLSIYNKLLRCLHNHSPFNTWFPIIRKSLLFLTFILTWIGYLKLSQLTLSTFLLILIIYYQRLFNFPGNICFNQLIRIWLCSLVFLNVLLEILIVRRCFTLTLV